MTTETKEQRDTVQNLGDEISKGEGGYKSYNTGTAKVNGKTKIVFSGIKQDMFSLSVDQLHESSKLSPFDKNRVFAAGKYQIICDTRTGTLLAAKKAMKLSGSEKFTPELQEQIFMHFLIGPIKRPVMHAYIQNGKGTADDAVYDAAKEWASIEVPNGRKLQNGNISNGTNSYYQGTGGNSAHKGSGAKVKQKLEAARAAYAAAQSGGGTKLPTQQPTPIIDEQSKHETKPEKQPTEQQKPEKTTEKTDRTVKKTADDYRGYQLTGSVGTGGENKEADVEAVQTRLGFFGITTKVDGKLGPNTLAAIKQFQKPFGIRDGLVEVGKKTQRELFSGQVTVEAKLDEPNETEPTKEEKTTEKKTEDDDETRSQNSGQMSKLASVATSESKGKKPDGFCYRHVKAFIREAGGYGNIKNIQTDKRFAGAIGEARMFAERVDSLGPAKFGLEKLSVSTPFEAPDGALVVVKPGSPGTRHPTAGDITVAGAGTEFYNGGTMRYGGPKAWPVKRGGLLGVYIPKK